jgi:hypothetical protein
MSKNSIRQLANQIYFLTLNKKIMDIQAEKHKLIEWLASINDQNLIEKIKLFRDNLTDNTDWWETISQSEKDSIDRGLKDIEAGRVIPHHDVMKKYGK